MNPVYPALSRPILHRAAGRSSFWGMAGLVALHILLGLLLKAQPWLGLLHAWGILLLGILLAVKQPDVRKVIPVAAYLVGAEVLWRMVGVPIWWEFGKYGLVAILGVALIRHLPWKNAGLPVFYFLLLCVSIPLTLNTLGFTEDARTQISFNLSGPLALAVCVLFFCQVRLGLKELRQAAWMAAFPVVSILTLAVASTLLSPNLVFTGESNFVTSGGFGPNQVSAVLGMGAVLLFLASLNRRGWLERLFAGGLVLAFLTQGLLTFSRGGMYNAAIAIGLAVLHLSRDKRMRGGILLLLLALVLVVGYVIFPQINDYTGGKLQQRFLDTDPTARGVIALGEFSVWLDHPILGVGPGIAKSITLDVNGRLDAAHTEYTRMLAEHGIFGIIALCLLLVMAAQAYLRAPNKVLRAWVVALAAWPLVEMGHAAMRIAAIAFLFGLACSNWRADDILASREK